MPWDWGITALLVFSAAALSSLPLSMAAWNLWLYRRPKSTGPLPPGVSVLIPARDEADGIEAAVQSALGSLSSDDAEVALEVVVLDDHSTDGTDAIVSRLAETDPRVRLVSGETLPEGWCGKQYACWQLAQHATHDRMLWIDADVRLEPGTMKPLLQHFERAQSQYGTALLSGVPRQITGSIMEKLVVHLIPVVLLGYLPMIGMRLTQKVGFGAGCGQLFMTTRQGYAQAGGHRAIRASLHDGVTLPRVYRQAGLHTDLVDLTGTASCRMYRDTGTVWRGFMKNATEGMATPVGIVVWSVLLLGGFVLPWALGLVWLAGVLPGWGLAVGLALGMALLLSVMLAWRFKQGVTAALLRPVGIVVLLAIQWVALWNKWRGTQATWRGRGYAAG